MLKAWVWTSDEVEDSYVVLRIQIEGVREQYCLLENGQWLLREYNSLGEEDDWGEVAC